MLVRSLSGIGETAAMMVGAQTYNNAFSEDDLLRMQVANNIGNAGDEQIMQMLTMEHLVVSVPAGTEVYVVMDLGQMRMTELGGLLPPRQGDLRGGFLYAHKLDRTLRAGQFAEIDGALLASAQQPEQRDAIHGLAFVLFPGRDHRTTSDLFYSAPGFRY